jgi:phosphoglycolate phosphatase
MNDGYLWSIEEIKNFPERGKFHSALFDFDGTISLIRQGWQDVMKPYFFDVLRETPDHEDDEAILQCVHEFVDVNTGKQTIYQCIALAEEVAKRGGKALEPLQYKDEYQRRLLERVGHRIEGLETGRLSPADLAVPGSFALLEKLREWGLTLYLASGTDEQYVLNEARLLGVTQYFNGGIYGAQADYKVFSKKMIVNKIIQTHGLHGSELLGFGDGYVEIENVNDAGGFAVGVATDEEHRQGIDEWKRGRLINAGASIIIPDYSQTQQLLDYIFPGA